MQTLWVRLPLRPPRDASSEVEQRTFNPLVDGSIPSHPTIFGVTMCILVGVFGLEEIVLGVFNLGDRLPHVGTFPFPVRAYNVGAFYVP